MIEEFNNEDILVGLSGGINSAAVLCYLKECGIRPKSLHLFYGHFKEHSPDTAKFVTDCIRWARNNFDNVFVKIERNSIIKWFEDQNIIPHPANSPCSQKLKIDRINKYAFENGLRIDLVGYVKHELKRRVNRQNKNKEVNFFSLDKFYPIGEFTDEWCFEIVDRNIGWHPKIYDLKDANGKRLFKHNNCLPCKNMTTEEMELVKEYYPEYHKDAMSLSARLQKYWGRDKDSFYMTFGRDLGQESTCGACVW